MKTSTYDPSKWILVPVEPTEEMEHFGNSAADDLGVQTNGKSYIHDCDTAQSVWINMLSASPTPEETPQDFESKLGKLQNLIRIQSSPGNFDYSEYMRGLANGLLLAMSVFDEQSPPYHNAPTEEDVKPADGGSGKVVTYTDGTLSREIEEDINVVDGGEPVAYGLYNAHGFLLQLFKTRKGAEEYAPGAQTIRPLYAHPDRTNEMLLAALKDFKNSLELAKGIFAHYADLHSTKCTLDGDAKAQANLQHANSIALIIKKHDEAIKQAVAGR